MTNELYVGDIGAPIKVTVKNVDLTKAIILELLVKKPKEQEFTQWGTEPYVLDGKSSILYDTIDGDLSIDGVYTVRVYYEIGTDIKRHTSIATFVVLPI